MGLAGAFAVVVAASLIAGAVVAAWVRLAPGGAALISAFGGGILLAAVAFELLPEADEIAGPVWTASGVLAGAVVYVAVDRVLSADEQTEMMRRSAHAAAAGQPMEMTVDDGEVRRGETIAAGIVVDGVPESLALGFMVASGEPGLALLAAVVVGNLTEAYGAAQPIIAGGRGRWFAVGLLSGIAVFLAATTFVGGTLGTAMLGTPIGAAQAVAAGAILAVLSISVIPYTFETVNSLVALATAAGFVTGYLLS
jgi:zinc transporter, ZIP family